MQYMAAGSSEPVGSPGRPLLHGVQDCPPSVVRNTPTALIPTQIRFLSFGSIRIVCRHNPPFPGNHLARLGSRVRAESSVHVLPLSRLTNSPATSTPAKIEPL